MHGYINRTIVEALNEYLNVFPIVALLGPRQCGKSTLIKHELKKRKDFIYIDLELPSDRAKLEEPELFFSMHKDKIICLDEIQRVPDLFSVMRGVIDVNRQNGKFIILGSASGSLLRQSSESLAGRIGYLELTPFLLNEIGHKKINSYWLRGGFPDSFLAIDDKSSYLWRQQFIQTFLEKDIPALGLKIEPNNLRRFWMMCAHFNGQIFNASKIGASLGLSHNTIRRYLDILEQSFVIKTIYPFESNVKKRIIKAPKIYLRDTGVLHCLLNIKTSDELLGHPSIGSSWEALAINNILATVDKDWRSYYFRTSNGNEVDLILEREKETVAVEFKASTSPGLTKSLKIGMENINATRGFIVAPVKETYPIAENILVSNLKDFNDIISSHINYPK